ncbi:dsDNA nuclease domain-containing protein [Streptomyces sp. NPDC058572]|uniref:dsDNA nuclease domain-containing protein n=1 Tax=Streptomyces sp. NPDC058572 TaxID=3346546 RepID=UPI003647C8A2
MTEPVSTGDASRGILGQLAKMDGEPTGTKTFGRYLWQAKQAVRSWLSCLAPSDSPLAVLCERNEDIALIYQSGFRFAQLKTRDRGAWSGKGVCDNGHGIDSLVRTYKSARASNLHECSTFELWLEGPMSDRSDTVKFFERPSQASDEIRKKIVSLGLPRGQLGDFLERLIIRAQQPAQAHIDAVIIRQMAAIWRSHSFPELEDVYQRLLEAVSAAQAGHDQIGSIRRLIDHPLSPKFDLAWLDEDPQALTTAMIQSLTPPLDGESDQQLLERMARGESTSMLELKLRRAGATDATIQQAHALRAQSDVVRQLSSASRSDPAEEFEQLADRVLLHARALAARVSLNGVANPLAAARPAEMITAEILSDPSVGQLDRNGLLDSDTVNLYGYLCHLSDKCLFPWRSA